MRKIYGQATFDKNHNNGKRYTDEEKTTLALVIMSCTISTTKLNFSKICTDAAKVIPGRTAPGLLVLTKTLLAQATQGITPDGLTNEERTIFVRIATIWERLKIIQRNAFKFTDFNMNESNENQNNIISLNFNGFDDDKSVEGENQADSDKELEENEAYENDVDKIQESYERDLNSEEEAESEITGENEELSYNHEDSVMSEDYIVAGEEEFEFNEGFKGFSDENVNCEQEFHDHDYFSHATDGDTGSVDENNFGSNNSLDEEASGCDDDEGFKGFNKQEVINGLYCNDHDYLGSRIIQSIRSDEDTASAEGNCDGLLKESNCCEIENMGGNVNDKEIYFDVNKPFRPFSDEKISEDDVINFEEFGIRGEFINLEDLQDLEDVEKLFKELCERELGDAGEKNVDENRSDVGRLNDQNRSGDQGEAGKKIDEHDAGGLFEEINERQAVDISVNGYQDKSTNGSVEKNLSNSNEETENCGFSESNEVIDKEVSSVTDDVTNSCVKLEDGSKEITIITLDSEDGDDEECKVVYQSDIVITLGSDDESVSSPKRRRKRKSKGKAKKVKVNILLEKKNFEACKPAFNVEKPLDDDLFKVNKLEVSENSAFSKPKDLIWQPWRTPD